VTASSRRIPPSAIIAKMSSATTGVQAKSTVRGVLESVSDDAIVIALPHTDYRLHLVPGVPASTITTPVGKRIKGEIHARALRLFKAVGGGGGQFIEPLEGSPRIVAGRVLSVDAGGRRVLVSAAIPMWMTLAPDNTPEQFAPGDMVNCYVESGTRFVPAK
jgi:hypothetical protein